MSYEKIKQKLDKRAVIIIDGGTGTDIQRRGAPMSGQTWCADVNETHPQIVSAVHETYLQSGAEIITANTFATSALSFNCYGRDDDVITLDRIAVDQAKVVAAASGACVAGSVSTMRPVIAGGDRTDLSVNWTKPEAQKLFKRKIDNLSDCGVDMLMLEMMRDDDYSLWACEVAKDSGLPFWINISVERNVEGHLAGFGRTDCLLEKFAPALAKLKPDAMTIMHSSPAVTGEALSILKKSWNGPLGAYPESGFFKSPDWVFTVLSTADLVDFSKAWKQQGVTIFGGCCGIGPDHILALHKELRN